MKMWHGDFFLLLLFRGLQSWYSIEEYLGFPGSNKENEMSLDLITGTTGVLGLIGNPVRHTLSPLIHNTLSEELGQDLRYLPFPVEEDVAAAVRGAYRLGIRGLNVTVPHKTAVMEALVDIDEKARIIGAVNTLVRTEGGFKGYNTDMPGLGRALTQRGIHLAGQQVIVLGAGGASRAVCTLALSEGAESVYLLNRTIENAKALADDLNPHFPGNRLKPLAASDYAKVPRIPSIMIQCTSLGLHEGDGLLIDDDDFYHLATYGYDLVYNPAVTPFLRKCEGFGIPADNGLSMLLYQGIIAYELWTGISVSEQLAERVLTRLKRRLYGENVVLVGYMGCGKSTVGQALAEKTGRTFLDTDAAIEEAEDCSIREIFESEGEEAFRRMETDLLRRLADTAVNTVIATGGGIVLREENRKLLTKTGKVIWLSASPETTMERVKSDSARPLLDSASVQELDDKIRSMLTSRGPAYSAASGCKIDTDGKSVEEIVRILTD